MSLTGSYPLDDFLQYLENNNSLDAHILGLFQDYVNWKSFQCDTCGEYIDLDDGFYYCAESDEAWHEWCFREYILPEHPDYTSIPIKHYDDMMHYGSR
jgi:hypothetical protein